MHGCGAGRSASNRMDFIPKKPIESGDDFATGSVVRRFLIERNLGIKATHLSTSMLCTGCSTCRHLPHSIRMEKARRASLLFVVILVTKRLTTFVWSSG